MRKNRKLISALLGGVVLSTIFGIYSVAAQWAVPKDVLNITNSAIKATNGTKAVAYFNTRYFATVKSAVDAANNVGASTTVYVIPGTKVSITEDITINSGVTLCLPYDNETWDYGDPTKSGLSDSFIDTTASNVNKYRVTHLSLEGCSITVNSGANLYIGGKFRAKGICGTYTQISLDSQSHITVAGTLINYGYIKETDGLNPLQEEFYDVENKYNNEIDENRYVEVLSGGKLKNALACYNNLGASYLSGLNDNGICPTDTFDFPNMQTYVKVHSGGILEAQAKIYVTSSYGDKAVNTTATLISSASIAASTNTKPLFYLESGYISFENCPTDVLYSNANSRSIINIHGTTNMGYLYLNLDVATIDTSKMFLPLSYKLKVILGSDTAFTSNYSLKFLAGSSLTIDSGVVANLNASTIFYKSASMNGLSTTYPEALDDAYCLNNGSIIFGANSYFGGYVKTTAIDDSAMIDTTKIAVARLTATSYEGLSNSAVTIKSTGDFYINDLDTIDTKPIDGNVTILSRADGKQCWANGFVDSVTLSIKVINPNGYAKPASGFKAYGYNSSGGNETVLSSEDKFELDLGEYQYYLKTNEQFKITSLGRNESAVFTSQSGSSYTFSSDTKYVIKGNIELTITAGEGYEMWFTSSSQSGNSGSTKTIYESSTSSGTFHQLLVGGAGGQTEKLIIGKNQYFKVKYAKGTGTASFKGFYKFSGHNSTTSSTSGGTAVGTATTSNAIFADAEYTILAYLEGGCILPNTLITMADGTFKPVKDIVQGDLVKVFNHETGEIDIAPITFNDHEEAAYVNVINLYFSNGSYVGVVSEHGFFDLDTMRYEYIDETNYQDFIGHRFYSESGEAITLTNAYVDEQYTEVYSPTSFFHLDYFTEGVLSMPGGIEGLFNIFEYADNLQYDQEAYARDIETYGLFTYEDLAPLGVTEIMFEAYAGKYLKVALGKGILTEEYLAYLIERYGGFTE